MVQPNQKKGSSSNPLNYHPIAVISSVFSLNLSTSIGFSILNIISMSFTEISIGDILLLMSSLLKNSACWCITIKLEPPSSEKLKTKETMSKTTGRNVISWVTRANWCTAARKSIYSKDNLCEVCLSCYLNFVQWIITIECRLWLLPTHRVLYMNGMWGWVLHWPFGDENEVWKQNWITCNHPKQ